MRNEALSEWEREGRDYADAKAQLNARQRAKWARIEEWYEWFDGESGTAHAVLNQRLREGKLGK